MKQDNKSYGIGFVGLLQVAFIVLKLCKVINWKWVWVLSPVWIYTIFIILLVGIIFIYSLIKNKEKEKSFKKWLENDNDK